MDISLIPLYIYKIPKNCSDILVTPNLMYSIQAVEESDEKLAQDDSFTEERKVPVPENLTQSIGVIASNATELRIGEDAVRILFFIQFVTIIIEKYLQEFSKSSQLALFQFQNETIINIYRSNEPISSSSDRSKMPPSFQNNKTYFKHLKLTQNNTKNRRKFDDSDDLLDDRRYLRTEFPSLEMNKCVVVTDRNVYMIELK